MAGRFHTDPRRWPLRCARASRLPHLDSRRPSGQNRSAEGFTGTLEFSGVYTQEPVERLEIAGTTGTLFYDYLADRISLQRPGREPEVLPIPQEQLGGWTVEADFIDAVRVIPPGRARIRISPMAFLHARRSTRRRHPRGNGQRRDRRESSGASAPADPTRGHHQTTLPSFHREAKGTAGGFRRGFDQGDHLGAIFLRRRGGLEVPFQSGCLKGVVAHSKSSIPLSLTHCAHTAGAMNRPWARIAQLFHLMQPLSRPRVRHPARCRRSP